MRNKTKIINRFIWTSCIILESFLSGLYVANSLHDLPTLVSPLPSNSVHAQESIQQSVEADPTAIPTPTKSPTQAPRPTPRIQEQNTQGSKNYSSVQQEAISAIKVHFPENWQEAVKVSTCESSLGLKLTNGKSSAKGLFHILKGTWADHKCTGDPFNPSDNAACAKKIYNKYGWSSTASWHASLSCHKLK